MIARKLAPERISQEAWNVLFNVAAGASPYARYALPGLIKDLTLVTVEGGPHNIGWTHPDEVNSALMEFLAR